MKFIRYIGILVVIFIISLVGSAQATTTNLNETVVDLIRSDDHGIEVAVKFPGYEVGDLIEEGDEYDQLFVPGTDKCIQPGQPELPVKNLLVAIPPDVQYQLKVIQGQVIELDDSYRLPISPAPAPISNDFEPGILMPADPILQSELSRSGECIPTNVVKIAQEAWVRDQRILNLQVFPFLYTADESRLEFYPNIHFEIQFNWSDTRVHDEFVMLNEPGNPFEHALKNTLLNYEQGRQWRGYSLDQVHPYQKMPYPLEENLEGSELYKITISEDGFYKLTYEVLNQSGLPVDSIDPRTLRITNQGDEVAIYVHNIDTQEKFSPGEYIIFYGEHFSGEKIASLYPKEDDLWISYPYNDGTGRVWQPEFNAKMVEKYTDQNVYWLSYGGESGKRMAFQNEASGGTVAQATKAHIQAEESNFWRTYLFSGEDTWYWERIQVGKEPVISSYLVSIPHPANLGGTATIHGELIFENFDTSHNPDHQVKGYLNDNLHTSPIFVSEWDGKGRFSFEATFPDDILLDGTNKFDLIFENLYGNVEAIYFDWFEISYNRQLIADNNRIWLTGGAEENTLRYTIDGFSDLTTDDIYVFNITDSINPIWLLGGTLKEGSFTYTFNQPSEARYFIGEVKNLYSDSIKVYLPEKFDTPAEYVLITNNNFITETKRLADYRTAQGISTLVVDIDQLINQFNYGVYHPIAIKNFIAYTFDPQNWSFPPTYVVLVGDGHWNFLNYPSYDSPPIYMPPNLTWVDPWQGEVDSANLLANVVNPESIPDPIADVLISRIPVNSNLELAAVVDKIINFEQSDSQDWERNFFFLTDDPDSAGNFTQSAENLINELTPHGIIPYRMYLDYFQEQGNCTPDNSSACPELREYFIDNLEENGALFVNYYGHGWIYRWASESLFLTDDVFTLNNSRLPIIFSSTCLDGYWIHPNAEINSYSGSSLIEVFVRRENYGAIAAFSPTGLGLSTGHDYLQQGFYDALYVDGTQNLGTMSLQAKIRLFETQVYKDLLHTFTLFGDPALRIPQAGLFRIGLPILFK